ncbi:MAG: ThuA domain-containing protein [Planctomycetales bacterium]
MRPFASRFWQILPVVLLLTTAGYAPSLPAAEPPHVSPEHPLKICLISGSGEYESAKSMPKFKQALEDKYHIKCTLLLAEDKGDKLPGLEDLDKADLVVLFTRRLKVSPEELKPLLRFVESKKPIIGIRTASHGFQNYLQFDKDIMGGNYKGHLGTGTHTLISRIPAAASHPLLKGVGDKWESEYTLYKTSPLAEDCVPVLTGECSDHSVSHPAAWIRERDGRRLFYTSLGGLKDWDNPNFQKLLWNAILWTSQVPETSLVK